MMLSKLMRRIRALVNKGEVERELDEELQYHLDHQIEQNLKGGMNPAEARYAALSSFGGVEQAKENCRDTRGVRFIEDLWQDLRYGLRMLLKKPGFTFFAVVTLALGTGTNTAIFTVVNAVLLRPLPYPESEKLMVVGRTFTGDDVSALSEPKFVFLRDNCQSFEAITATQGMGSNVRLSEESQAEYIRGLIVTADFFRVMGALPASGRSFTSEEDSPAGERVVILGDGLWRRHFGADAGIIGRTITLNDVNRRVVGIMPPEFEYYGTQDVFVPMRANPASQNEGHNWTVIGRLKQSVSTDRARAELTLLFDKFQSVYPRMVSRNETFSAMNWRMNMTRGVRELLWILFGTVTFVLLIGCANVANLQLTRAAARRKEMAIRMALGARSWRLIRQMLTEGMVLALLGGFGGLLLATWGLSAMLALVPAGMIPRADEVTIDWRVLTFALGTSLLTSIIFSLAPALQSSRVDVNRAIKEGADRTHVTRWRLRGALVVVEIALAFALTVGAGLLLRTFANLRGIEPGFESRNLLTFEISPKGGNYDTVAKTNVFYDSALERFQSLPGVEAAALTNKLPLDSQFNLPYRLAGQTEVTGAVQFRLISRDYFRVMNMALQQGRSFSAGDTIGAEPVVIVNAAFARRNFSGIEPLGQQLCVGCKEFGDPSMRRIVGVVNDTKQSSLSEAAPATVFIPLAQAAEGVKEIMQQSSFVLRTSGDPLLLSGTIRSEMRQLDPNLPVRNLRSMEQIIGRSIAPQRFNLSLLSLFAALGLLLAAVGIYGVMAYSVSQRTHEFGIRMALGAQTRDVLKLIMRQGMMQALIGVGIGLIASLTLTRVMKSLLFGVSPTDPLTFALIALLLTTVALLACYIPARRAARVNPLTALRYE